MRWLIADGVTCNRARRRVEAAVFDHRGEGGELRLPEARVVFAWHVNDANDPGRSPASLMARCGGRSLDTTPAAQVTFSAMAGTR